MYLNPNFNICHSVFAYCMAISAPSVILIFFNILGKTRMKMTFRWLDFKTFGLMKEQKLINDTTDLLQTIEPR